MQGLDGASYFLSETLFSWDGHGTAPHEFNFETLLGSFIPPTHERRLLPPSFSARLNQYLPGFSVSVRYEFVVSVMRNAGPLEFWKKRSRYVPFLFVWSPRGGEAVLMTPNTDCVYLLLLNRSRDRLRLVHFLQEIIPAERCDPAHSSSMISRRARRAPYRSRSGYFFLARRYGR